ncbi:MAG: cation diffusion facilitator family transporter [Bacillota bacterium]
MKEFLWKKFVKDYENYKDPEVRAGYTRLTGTLGIIVNSVLCVIKIVLGFMINSIAVVADGVHDMVDSLAATITLAASVISRKPADKEHPYGHARVEYLASLIVSAIILIIGYQLLRSSIGKCIHPEPTDFSWLMVGFMIFAIILKGSQALFTIATGRRIDSLPVIAAGTDNRNDVISTGIIVLGMLLNHFAGIDIDGYLGCLVSLFIFYTGIQLIRETIGPLLGAAPDPETVEDVRRTVLSHPEILGVHDIVINNYGPGRTFATFHAVVDSTMDLMSAHAAIDHVERELLNEYNINAAGHMDPIVVDDPVRIKAELLISEVIENISGIAGFHDVRIIQGDKHPHVIFDIVLEPGAKADIEEIRRTLTEAIHEKDDSYHVIIDFEQSYV